MESLLASCLAYQANGPETQPGPLRMSPLPPEPWHTVHINFCGPFPTGGYFLAVMMRILNSQKLTFSIP